MNPETFDTADSFLQVMESHFQVDEAVNGLIYGLALRLRDHPDRHRNKPFLCVARAAGAPVHAALMTPPYNLIVWGLDIEHPNSEGLEAIARVLIRDHWPMAGVLGPAAISAAFAGAWGGLTYVPVRREMRERVYELRRVTPPRMASGGLRTARADDLPLILEWYWRFIQEAGLRDTRAQADESARYGVEHGAMFVWEDGGQVVSLAGSFRETPHGQAVGPVYTPPELRGRGYASNCVAALSQRVLASGKDFATLFTDLANPASNSIYQKIGYVPRCDFDEWRFG